MAYYCTTDDAGRATGFYEEELHGRKGAPGSRVPPEAIAITAAEWRELVENGPRRKLVDGRVVEVEPPPPPTPEPLGIHIVKRIHGDPTLRAILRLIATREGKALEEILEEIKAAESQAAGGT